MANLLQQYSINADDDIGSGTFGIVYHAKHKETNTVVAVKKLALCQSGTRIRELSEMASKEFKILQNLQDHPNIVRLIGQHEGPKNLWIFMELCDCDLRAFMKNHHCAIRQKLKIMYQCSDAINFMHTRNPKIVHRDIKPTNVLMKTLREDALVKITDFGMGRVLSDMRKDELMSTFGGSQHFMAPEFFRHIEEGVELKYSFAVDTFALGLLFQSVLLYSRDNADMTPRVADASPKTPQHMPVAQQMVLSQKQGNEMPKLFDSRYEEMKGLQRVIIDMCSYEGCDRPPLEDIKKRIWRQFVETEYNYMTTGEDNFPTVNTMADVISRLDEDRRQTLETNEKMKAEFNDIKEQVLDTRNEMKEELYTVKEAMISHLTQDRKQALDTNGKLKAELLAVKKEMRQAVDTNAKMKSDLQLIRVELDRQNSLKKENEELQSRVADYEKKLQLKTDELKQYTLRNTAALGPLKTDNPKQGSCLAIKEKDDTGGVGKIQQQLNSYEEKEESFTGDTHITATYSTGQSSTTNPGFSCWLPINSYRHSISARPYVSDRTSKYSGRSSKSRETTQDQKTEKEDETCCICMCEIDDPKTLKCNHTFCKECIDRGMKIKPVCPICGAVYGKITGNQPINGIMRHQTSRGRLPGYDSCGTIEIFYSFPSGIQTEEHDHPGRRYTGTNRRAYLPDNQEGRHVLKLLEEAFKARLVFTVGSSRTTGATDTVTWAYINHKTNMYGGPDSSGYPDATYLSIVKEELAAHGIK